MEIDKGFFIENLLKESKSDKCKKILEGKSSNEQENSIDQEEDNWLNPGSYSTSQMTDVLPTVYPVISNRLDTLEGIGD